MDRLQEVKLTVFTKIYLLKEVEVELRICQQVAAAGQTTTS